MKYETFIARRYISSNKQSGFISFITAIAILGVAIGIAVLIIALAVMTGFERELTTRLIGFASHIQIQGFQNQPLQNYRENADKILKMEGVKNVSPFIQREALMRGRNGVDGVMLKGIDPEYNGIFIKEYLQSGIFDLGVQEERQTGIIIGNKLAEKLNLGIGDLVTLFALEPVEGPTIGFARAAQFVITGIYETGMAEYDDIYVFVHLSSAQRMLRMENSVSGYDLHLYDVNEIESMAEKLMISLGYPHYPRTMYSLYRHLFTWIELQKKPIPVILGLIILVASVNIIGILLILVMEKTKQIGVLKTLGSSPGEISKIFIFNGSIIGIIGVILGNFLGYLLSAIQYYYKPISIPGEIYYMNFVPISIEPIHYVIVSFIAFVMCLASTLIPARLASKLDPIKTIRFT